MTGLSESEFYKKYPTKAHFEKEHGADIFDKGGFIQDDSTKKQQKAFNKAEQMYNDSLALFNSANIDNQWMANIDKTKVSRKDYKAQMQIQDRDALQEAYDRLLRTNNQAPEISSDTLNVLRSDNPKATKELILMNQYKKPTNPPLNPKNFPTKKERDAMDLKQMQLNQQFANGGLLSSKQKYGGGGPVLTPLAFDMPKSLTTPTTTFTPSNTPNSGNQGNSKPSGDLGLPKMGGAGAGVGSLIGGLIGGGGALLASGALTAGTGGAGIVAALPTIAAGVGIGSTIGGAAGGVAGMGVDAVGKGINKISQINNQDDKQKSASGVQFAMNGGLLGGLGGATKSFFGDGRAMENNTELQKLMQNLKDTNEGKLTEINAGGTHEENPNNGVPIMEGKLAEQNETIFDSNQGKFIFSDRNGYADESKKIEKKYSKRPNDKLSNDSRKRELSALMLKQEAEKALVSNEVQNNEMFDIGGLLSKTPGAFDIKVPTYDIEAAKSIAKVKGKYNVTQFLNGIPLDRDLYKQGLQNGTIDPARLTTLDNSGVRREIRPTMEPMKTLPATQIDMPKIKQPNITGGKVDSTMNLNLPKSIDLSMLEYLPQTAGSLFNIAKGIGSNKQINYKGITPRLMNNNYNLTSSLTNLNSDSAGVNTDIRTNSNLTLAQKISALGSVAANTQKAKAGMINQSNFANMGANNNLINSAKQYNAGVFDRNIDANEMYQDKRAEAIKTGLDTLGTGSSTYIKDKKANKYENANNKMLADLFKELYPEATKRAKFK